MKKLSNRAMAALLTAALVVIVLLLIVGIILLPRWFSMTLVFLPLTVLLLYMIYRVILAVLEDREAERVWSGRNNYKAAAQQAMSAWSHLSNAHHIDWVIESLKTRPELWVGEREMAYDAAWDMARHAARDERDAAYIAARYAAWDAALNAARGAAYDTAYDALLALVAYDDCEQYLSMTSEELRAWALLTEHPAAILLLPMVIVREQLEQLAA